MLPWIVGTFLFLLAYLGGVIISIILIGTSRFEILLLLGFAIVEAAIGFYLWVCIVSLFQVNNSTALMLTSIVAQEVTKSTALAPVAEPLLPCSTIVHGRYRFIH